MTAKAQTPVASSAPHTPTGAAADAMKDSR